MYISWYGFGRMFIEGLRTDSLYVGDFRISQLVGFACFFIGSAMLIAMLIVTHLRKKEAGELPSRNPLRLPRLLPERKKPKKLKNPLKFLRKARLTFPKKRKTTQKKAPDLTFRTFTTMTGSDRQWQT